MILYKMCIFGQSIHFKHIGLKDGLSSSNISDIIEDQHGNLLIATNYGLNKYDGNHISKIPDQHLKDYRDFRYTCLLKTSNNEIFVGTSKGLFYFDKNQVLTRAIIKDTIGNYRVIKLFEDKIKKKTYMLTGNSSYILSNNEWILEPWLRDSIKSSRYYDINLHNDRFLICNINNSVKIIDLHKKSKIHDLKRKNSTSSIMINENTLLTCNARGRIIVYDLDMNKIIKTLYLKENVNGEIINTSMLHMRKIDETYIGITTEDDGFKLLNKNTLELTHYRQNIEDINSIITNQTTKIYCGQGGNVYLTYLNEGLSVFNLKATRVEHIPMFKDFKNTYFQSYVNSLIKAKNGNWIIGGTDRVLSYNPNTNISTYHFFSTVLKDEPAHLLLGFKTIYQDHKDRFWLGSHRGGIILTDHKLRKITTFAPYNGARHILSNFIWDIDRLSDGKMWICTSHGLLHIDPNSLVVDTLKAHSTLRLLPRSRCKTVFEDSEGNVWIGYEFKGLYRYSKKNKTLKSYLENNTLPFKHCYQIYEDHYGNIYVAHEGGFSVLNKNETWINYNIANGLRFKLVEGFVNDSLNNVWIGNHTCLIKYNPLNKEFKYFEENFGMGNVSLINNTSIQYGDNIVWGTERGLIKFNPYKLDKTKNTLNVYISEVVTKEKTTYVGDGKEINLTEGNGLISIIFSGVNMFGSKKVNFQYIMDSYNDQWTNTSTINKINFASLPAGKYTLRVKGSIDGAEWIEAKFPLKMSIKGVFWKNPFFVFTLLGIISFVFFYWYKQKLSAESKQSDLKKQLAELEVRAIRAQMNPHFVFNALNSIQYFTYSGDVDKANEYLSDFAKLMRLVLQQSKDGNITLDNEIELLTLYLKIEALKFENNFTFEVTKDNTIDEAENYVMPSMIVQPFAENAIKHGLLPKDGQKNLKIIFSIKGEALQCIVEDDGIGISASKELLEKQTMKVPHQSMGMDLVKKRLKMYKSPDDRKPDITVIEKKEIEDKGTKVIITLPI